MFELFAKLAIALAFLKIQHVVIGHVNILAKLVFDATTQLKNVDPVVNEQHITKPEFAKCFSVSLLVNKLSKAHPEFAKLFANSGVE
jgi:hypothetical protein